MTADKAARATEELARELDLVVFRLESVPSDVDALLAERRRLRRELEQLRDRMIDLARDLDR